MSANECNLKSEIDNNKPSKTNDIPKHISANQPDSDSSDDVTDELYSCHTKIIRLQIEYEILQRDALLITKTTEEKKQQAEAYKKAFEAQTLICKQQEEQIQAAKAVAEANAKAEADARIAAERLAWDCKIVKI